MKSARFGVLVLLLVSLLAVGISPGCAGGSGTTSSTQQGLTTAATTSKPITTGGQGQTTAATTGAVKPGGMPDIADQYSLSSYRFSIMTKMIQGPGAGSTDYMKYEWVKAQKAEHSWREDAAGAVTEVYIQIGDRYWIWMPMMGWVEQEPQPTSASAMPSDLADQLEQALEDVANSRARFDKKGTETVNGVQCTKYEFDYYLTTELPNFATGGTTKTEMHSSGNMWIASQGNLPAVVIRSKSTVEIDSGGQKMVMESEQNLTDIGANIDIKPPEGAVQIPTGPPGLPTGTSTRPATTTAPKTTTRTTGAATTSPPAATGGTLLFGDDFQGAWDSRWEWLDPNDDASYNFEAHAGFLRLTVPDGNDLAGVANYDAPRLLTPQTGDFRLETLIEFDPKEVYQGAGLLVWQDENTFLRLEFGFGGMGGEAKNVVFVKQEEGNLSLVDSADVPDTVKRIELRLQRKGSVFTAWYRLAGGTWQEVGSTEFALEDTVQVGIAQVTQYTPTAIYADFDYIRIYAV